jgi:hypothetical protein
LLRDEQFGFRPRYSTALHLARLVERVNRDFDERRLTGAVFLDVAKAFDTIWAKGLFYMLTVLNFRTYLVKTVSSYLDFRTFQTSFQSATSTRRVVRAGAVQGGLVSAVLFSLYINDIPFRHVELAQYADDMALIATSRSPSLLVGHLEACLGRLELWLCDWKIVVSVSQSTAMLFVKAARRVQKPRLVQFLGEPIEFVETARCRGVTLDTRLTWSAHVNQLRKKAAQRLGVLGPLLKKRSRLSVRNGVLFHKQFIYPVMHYACPIWRSAARSHVRKLQVFQSKCLRIATDALWYVGNR